MPRISSFYGIVITMYHDDHGYPHFHARHASGRAKVRIDSLEALESTLDSRRLRLVLAWGGATSGGIARELAEGPEPCEATPDRATSMIGLTPDITAVSVVRHGVLRLAFEDGLIGEVDVLDRMWGPVFERARTQEGFVAVTVDEETGTVAWPEGADLAPDTLYVRVSTGAWPDRGAAA